jgi:glucuronoarabinoxylan endo-1,4-beta-xylanase
MSLLRVQIDPGGNWGDETSNASAAHAAGAKVLGSSWSAPAAWTTTGNAYDGQLLPARYADYANWLTQARSSINLDWVSPANEPDLGWMSWTSDEYISWIGQYGGSLGAPLLAPESCWFADEYTDAIIDDPVAGPNVSVVGGHGYGGISYHSDPISKGKHCWMTENYLTGGQDTIGESVAIAQNISDYMNCQFSAYISWWVTDGDTNCNLVYSDGTIYKNGYAMGQFAKWVRPGSTRVSSDYNPQTGVSVTAYKVTNNAVIVAVNANTYAVNQPFVINNGSGAPLEGYRTSSSEGMADIGRFGGSSGSFTANLPAQSITTFVQTNVTLSNLPPPWSAQDIGSVGLYGSVSFTNGVFSVAASGNDIWDTADAFRFVYVPVTNNCTIIARVASLQNVDGWSKAGVMIRASLASNAPNAFVAVTPGNGVTWQCRSSTNGTTANAATGGLSAPYWVKLVRSGNTFTGYCSPDGTNWTAQGTTTFTMATNAYVGLAVTAHNNSDLCEATFDHVTGPSWVPPSASVPTGLVATAGIEQVALSWMAASNANAGYNVYRANTSGGPYSNVANVTTTNYTDTGLNDRTTYYYVVTAVNRLAGESANSAQVSATTTVPVPYPWLTRDVGSVGLAGSASFTNGVFTVTGSGADIQNTADAFRFVYVATNSGNCSIIARVASLQNIDGWSKAGVMIRDSLNPGAANVFVAVTPGNGATFQYRSSDGGGCNYNMTSGSAPYWVKLVQSNGTNFTGYCSPDGTNWTQVGSATLTGVTNAYIGLAVTSHNNSSLCTATFDNVSVKAIRPASFQLETNWGPFVPTTGDGPISMYVYVPANVVANPPILVELHYCGGTGPSVFGWAGGLSAAADKYGFIIVAPSASDNSGNARCWNPSSTNALTRYGGGDTEAIVKMVNYTISNYGANSNRV